MDRYYPLVLFLVSVILLTMTNKNTNKKNQTKEERADYLRNYKAEHLNHLRSYNKEWMRKRRAELRASGEYDKKTFWKKKKKYPLGFVFASEIFGRKRRSFFNKLFR